MRFGNRLKHNPFFRLSLTLHMYYESNGVSLFLPYAFIVKCYKMLNFSNLSIPFRFRKIFPSSSAEVKVTLVRLVFSVTFLSNLTTNFKTRLYKFLSIKFLLSSSSFSFLVSLSALSAAPWMIKLQTRLLFFLFFCKFFLLIVFFQ